MASKVAAIILAAGKSQRMGQPKMLLRWRDTTVLGQVVMTFSRAGIQDIIVVTGGDGTLVEGEVARLAGLFPTRAAFNPSYESEGMMASIQAGIKAMDPEYEAVLIGLGDQPQVEEKTVRDILATYEELNGSLIVPSYENRRGHPVLIDATYLPELHNLTARTNLRDFLNTHRDKIWYVEAGPSVLMDLDTPEDYQRFHEAQSGQ